MKKIKIFVWKAKNQSGEEIEENTLSALNVLLSLKRPEDQPKGLDNFRLLHRLSEAFEKAEKTSVLELEESDYSFLKKLVETEIPSFWGMNKQISEAIEEFMNPKE
jgi:hypothetical protein